MSNVRKARIVQLEAQTCPRRMGEMGPWEYEPLLDHWERGRWAATQEEADAEVAEFMASCNGQGSIGNVLWCYPGEQPRTCSFCGGVHPDDAIALLRAGWTCGSTTKSYKRYLEPPGYEDWHGKVLKEPFSEWGKTKPPYPSPIPPVKLYTMHFTPEQIAAFNAVLTEVLRADLAAAEAQP